MSEVRKREIGKNGLYACPCCGFATLSGVGRYDDCEICGWEDDGQDDPNADEDWGGPNNCSLTEARKNFLMYGANCFNEKDMVNKEARKSGESIRSYTLTSDGLQENTNWTNNE